MATIELNTEHFPIVISIFSERFDDAEIEAYFGEMRAVLDRDQPFVHVNDLSAAGAMSSASMRRRASDFMTAENERSARLCYGAVQIAPSALMRGVMTALHWVSPPPYPYSLVSTMGEAMTWATKRCEASGLVLKQAPTNAA